MKRIEKKRIYKKTATPGVVVDIVITIEQVLVDDVPMVKVTVGWNADPEPLCATAGIGVLKDNRLHFIRAHANAVITANEDPATWQDVFIAPADFEVEDLPVEVQP